MKKFAYMIIIILSLRFISSCGALKNSDIMDYYTEYRFELPFNHSINNAADVLYFKTEYSIEQMNQLINNAGYSANLYENGNVQTILISAVKNKFIYYFVIYDKNHSYNKDVYMLSSAALSIKFDENKKNYVFLAPIHIIDTTTDYDTKKVYSSFEDIANFYRATGKNDIEIDDVNKTIIFKCEGNSNLNWAKGTIAIHYIENETGNYLYFIA